MKEELEYSLNKFKNAFIKLEKGISEASTELGRDGVIQRFEFTFELLWKTLRLFLREQGIEAKTPKDCLKESFRIGWLKDEGIFAGMLEDRNNTSRVYSEAKAAGIFERIKDGHAGAIKRILTELEKRLNN